MSITDSLLHCFLDHRPGCCGDAQTLHHILDSFHSTILEDSSHESFHHCRKHLIGDSGSTWCNDKKFVKFKFSAKVGQCFITKKFLPDLIREAWWKSADAGATAWEIDLLALPEHSNTMFHTQRSLTESPNPAKDLLPSLMTLSPISCLTALLAWMVSKRYGRPVVHL